METHAPLHTYLENCSVYASNILESVLVWAVGAFLVGFFISVKTIGYLRKNQGFYRSNILWHFLAKIHFLVIPAVTIATLTGLAVTLSTHRFYSQHASEFFNKTVPPTFVDIQAVMAATPSDGKANRLDTFVDRITQNLHYQPKDTLAKLESDNLGVLNKLFHQWFIRTLSVALAGYALVQSNADVRAETNLFQPHLIRKMDLDAVAGNIVKNIHEKADTQVQALLRTIYRILAMVFGAGFGFTLFEFAFARLLQRREEF